MLLEQNRLVSTAIEDLLVYTVLTMNIICNGRGTGQTLQQ